MTIWHPSLDSFRASSTLIYGHGSLSGPATLPSPAVLQIRTRCGSAIGEIPLVFGATACGSPHSAARRFVIYGARPAPLPDHSCEQHPLPAPRIVPPGNTIRLLFELPWQHYMRRASALIRQGQWQRLYRKLARLGKALFARNYIPGDLLAWSAAGGNSLSLVIDHDLGGGANKFRAGLMAMLSASSSPPVLVTAQTGLMSYRLTATQRGHTRESHCTDLDELFALLSTHTIDSVFLNNLLSFPAPLKMVSTLATWMRATPTKPRLTILVHDYYCICPSWLLLNSALQYCGVPDPSACEHCLPANQTPLLHLAGTHDITTWRTQWQKLLATADEVRCFSMYSRNLMRRAYPSIAPLRLTVVPHESLHHKLRVVRVDRGTGPIVGIVGNIVHHKGSHIVRALAERILSTGSSVKLVIVGTIDEQLPAAVAQVTGPYRPTDLPNLIEESRVNIALFPSICAETYSYVTAELMEMNLPILCFDLGAPAERVRRYERGMIISSFDVDNILDGLQRLYENQVCRGGQA